MNTVHVPTVESYLPDYDWTPITGRPGGTYTNASPWKVLIHTIEGSVEGALSMYRWPNRVGCPHATVSLDRDIYLQHVPLDRSSYALRNLAGGTETNRDNVLQVEVEGYAHQVKDWPAWKLEKLALHVIQPMFLSNHEIEWTYQQHWSGSYGEANANRWSAAEWDSFGGLCSHQVAPENTHWDPGALDIVQFQSLLEGI